MDARRSPIRPARIYRVVGDQIGAGTYDANGIGVCHSDCARRENIPLNVRPLAHATKVERWLADVADLVPRNIQIYFPIRRFPCGKYDDAQGIATCASNIDVVIED